MVINLRHILIFKTNIQTYIDVQNIEQSLIAEDAIQQWNIDQKDPDCVLRIVSPLLAPEKIIAIINNCGYECAELI
jgi:hypothetical protein